MAQPKGPDPEAALRDQAEHLTGAAAQLALELRQRMELCLRDQEHALQLFLAQLAAPAASSGSLPPVGPSAAAAPLAGPSPEAEEAGREEQPQESTDVVESEPGSEAKEAKEADGRPQRLGSTEELVQDLNLKGSFQNYSAMLSKSFLSGSPRTDPAKSLVEQRLSSESCFLRAFWTLFYFLRSVQEPARRGRLASLVLGGNFEFLTTVMILAHGVVVVYQTDLYGRIAASDPADLQDHPGRRWDYVVESVFTIYFVAELLMKLIVHKLYFFCNNDWRWNIFDFLTIIVTVLDVFLTLIGESIAALDANFLRVVRVFRLAKSLRILRALHFVEHFRKILQCVISSLSHIIWSFVLLVFITAIFATVLCQCVTQFLTEVVAHEVTTEDATPVDLTLLRESFGSVTLSMLSLFKATSGGCDWGDYYNELSPTGFFAPFVMVLYVLFFLIAAWNIVTSLFLEKALMIAQPDMDTQLMEKRQQELSDANELLRLVSSMDDDGNGLIDLEEFMSKLLKPRVRAFLALRNIDVRDAEMFFHILQHVPNTSEIPKHTVVNALMKMRGVATNMDLQTLQFQIQVQNAANAQSFRGMEDQLRDVRGTLQLLVTARKGGKSSL